VRYITNYLISAIVSSFIATCCWATPKTEQDNVHEAAVYHILVRTQTQAHAIHQDLMFLVGPQLLEQFAASAAANSFDSGSSKKGGFLGKLLEGSMVEEFDRPVFQSQPMTLLQPFKSRYGWHVVYVADVQKIPVAQICSKAANREGSDIPPKEKDFARSVGPLLTASDRTRVASLLGDEALLSELSSDGVIAYVLPKIIHQAGGVVVNEHFELPYATLVATTEPPTCTRSYDRTLLMDCPNKRYAPIKAVGYANRASLGRAHLMYAVKEKDLKFIELGEGAEEFAPFKAACIGKAN
jgi:PPIC-type PPIASE domain